MDLHDDIKGIVRCCVQHFVERESGVVHDMVDLTIFAALSNKQIHLANIPTEKSGRNVFSRDSGINDLLGEVVGTNISGHREGVSSCSLDFSLNRLETLSVNAAKNA